MNPYADKDVLVLGLGVSGFSVARALLDMGARVIVSEKSETPAIVASADLLRARGAIVQTGRHDLSGLDVDLAVLSPGIPPSAPAVRDLERAGVPTISEVEVAFSVARCDFVAVTGTNGKTTTTRLIASMLEEGGIPSRAAGNIGFPLIDAVREIPQGGAIAVEVSSFQLIGTRAFRPRVAVLLNIAEDHTDWHGSFADYAAAKARIVANQTSEDVFLPNAEEPGPMAVAQQARSRIVPFSAVRAPADGIGVSEGRVLWRGADVLPVADIPLAGTAGIEDVVAAAGAALEFGVEATAIARAVKSFRPLPHRLEVIAEARGITFIDDSKATNPHATLAAVKGLNDVVLIAGGRSKGIDLSVLAATVPPVRAVVALGEAADQISKTFAGLVPVIAASSMLDAVERAIAHSIPGGSVLLSPACASLDMYESYEQRGEAFARAVGDVLRLVPRREDPNESDEEVR